MKGDKMNNGLGFLKIQLYTGDFALHGDSVRVLVKRDDAILHTLQSDENGSTEVVSLEAPSLENEDGLELGKDFFATVDVEVPAAQGFKAVKVYGVQIFDGQTSILNVQLVPIAPGDAEEIDIYVPCEHGVDIDSDNGAAENHEPGQGPEGDAVNSGDEELAVDDWPDPSKRFPHDPAMEEWPPESIIDDTQDFQLGRIDPPPIEPLGIEPLSIDPESYAQQAMEAFDDDPAALITPLVVPLANEVVIPDFITVHLGTPNAAARNVRVPFKEYIKNVVSSEIYPFWDRAAIEANTHAIVSFTLNRLFTEIRRLG